MLLIAFLSTLLEYIRTAIGRAPWVFWLEHIVIMGYFIKSNPMKNRKLEIFKSFFQ